MDNINNLIRKTTDIDIAGVSNLNLKETDVIQIWEEVSLYIDKYMSQSKGVSIPGFGTFSFVQKKIDIGNNKYILVQRPVFVISEKFAQTHGLSFTKYPVTGSIPVHPLNYTAVANETAFNRDDIESCVRHVLQVFNRSVQSRKNVEFTFTGIGKLQIRNSKVKMKFYKDFVNSFDETGRIVADLQNRAHTADSVMSKNDISRAHTRNTCLLPRLNSRSGAVSALDNNHILSNNNNLGAMDTISEENSDGANHQFEENAKVLAPVVSVYSSEDATNMMKNSNHNNENLQPNRINLELASDSSISNSKYRIPDLFSSKSSIIIGSHENSNNPPLNQNELNTVNAILTENAPSVSNSISNIVNYQKQHESPTPPPITTNLIRPSSRTLLGNLVAKPVASPCGHHNAGQELCYLCHQRHRRNVPVYLHEETRQKEQEEDQILMQYQSLKDLDKQLKDEEKRNFQRLDRAKIDAFNLGVSEAVRAKKHERPKTSDISRSFVFRKRVKTPPKSYKQHELGDYLSKQIEIRQKESLQNKQETSLLEKMEQMQLAEDLAAQREAYLKEKYQRQADLKASLDSQVKNKPSQLPKVLPDSEVFGQYDAKNEKLALMKRKELEAHKYHKEIIEQRKREQLLNQLREQERDAENIERVKEEYRIDRANRFERMIDMRKGLERSWKNADEEKKQRDLDERNHRMEHDGKLVHEQCDKYKRCAQCSRDLKNCGETNIWTDTRYLPGTRLMA